MVMGSKSRAAHEPPELLRSPFKTYECEILRRVWDRCNRRNEHFVAAIVGREGVGKSHTALKIARLVDPSFDADRVLHEGTELVKRLRDGEHEPGNAYVLDEAGVALGSRTWQSRDQVLVNQALQLVRSENLCLLLTLPAISELDSQARNRLHAFYEITDKTPGEHVSGKWKYVDVDRGALDGQERTPYPRVKRDGQTIRVTSLKFTPPAGELVERYDEKKAKHQQEVYERTIAELEEGSDDSDGDSERSVKELADEIEEEGVENYESLHGAHKTMYIDSDLIEAQKEVSSRKAKQVRKLLKSRLDR